jgi:hypothetical protein
MSSAYEHAQAAGIECLIGIARQQAAARHRATLPLVTVPLVTVPADQLALLAAEVAATGHLYRRLRRSGRAPA